jgi:DNA-directed RNA polymerase specialized sigma24 family protein
MSELAPTPSPSTPSDEFDALYLALRRRLLLQCLAQTGDLSAARAGVRDAFIAACQQWRRVSTLEQPEAWIRQRAMNAAQRHHAPHRRRAEAGLDEHQAAVMRALGDLKDHDRKALVLHHLGGLDAVAVGRDLSLTEATVRRRLGTAEDSYVVARGCTRAQISEDLRALAPIVTNPGLPRAHAIHHRAQRRGRVQIALGIVIAIGIAALGGLIVEPTPRSDALAAIDARPVTRAVFLSASQLDTTLSSASWQETSTSTNNSGTGLHDPCQRERFADPSAAGTWVRTLTANASNTTVTQRTEISVGDTVARRTYATTLSWYAACTQARVQLVAAAKLSGVGNQAWLLQLNAAGSTPQTYQVLIARSGMITSTLVLQVPTAKAAAFASTDTITELGRVMTQRLCRTSAAEVCRPVQKATATPSVPPVAENPGMIATVDIPPLATVQNPWVGTQPVTGGPNLAATTCDATTFSGAKTRARTFLIPGAGLAQSFGLTETIATYPTVAAASKAAVMIRSQMATCHKRQIGTSVSQGQSMAQNTLAPLVTIWHEVAQINSKRQVVNYWMGVTQQGRVVAQITFIPAGKADTTAADFLALVERGAQRLTQLP